MAHSPDIPAKGDSWRMFDRIAPTYDLVNRSLSMGQDILWRGRLSRRVPAVNDLHVLDLATGTGDQLLSVINTRPEAVIEAVGLDLSEGMLEVGRRKMKARGLDSLVKLIHGDASKLPFEDRSFHAVTMSFGIRNVDDVGATLAEIRRVLRPDGRALIMEFSLPRQRALRGLYLVYLRQLLPRLGGLISGDTTAYRYLNLTVEDFPYGEEFCDLMRAAGFSEASASPLTFGIASIYEGRP